MVDGLYNRECLGKMEILKVCFFKDVTGYEFKIDLWYSIFRIKNQQVIDFIPNEYICIFRHIYTMYKYYNCTKKKNIKCLC